MTAAQSAMRPNAGYRPVEPQAIVAVAFRGGHVSHYGHRAGGLRWGFTGDAFDIAQWMPAGPDAKTP